MPVSTVTTATYELVKYSRAYNHTPGTLPEHPELQWQHFANPVIRMTMDSKKSTSGGLESYRLRIVWNFNSELNSMDVDQREVVFEDLDLVSYSSLPTTQAPQGMPLKAVYQGSTVGLRYQHPRVTPPGAVPQYRRFQVAFESAVTAAAFVDSIRFVCPCKANAGPPPRIARASPAQARTPGPQSSQLSTASVLAPLHATMRPPASSMSLNEPLPSIRRTSTTLTPFPETALTTADWQSTRDLYSSQATLSRAPTVSPWHADGTDVPCTRPGSAYDSSRPSSAATASSAIAHRSSSDMDAPAAVSISRHRPPTAAPSPATAPAPGAATALETRNELQPRPTRDSGAVLRQRESDETSLPSSSLPHSSSSPPSMARLRPSSPELMPPPPVPAGLSRGSDFIGTNTTPPACAGADITGASVAPPPVAPAPSLTAESDAACLANSAANLTASLRDSADLYDLPQDELETLVAGIVREEGFAELMRSLDKMWRVKGLVGIV
ncbi:hypothetical protein BD413DRAFT_484914 [Trametes elegans]|nr:hypothetical protein BD413DRAFT_484914 [Trametes elegans]